MIYAKLGPYFAAGYNVEFSPQTALRSQNPALCVTIHKQHPTHGREARTHVFTPADLKRAAGEPGGVDAVLMFTLEKMRGQIAIEFARQDNEQPAAFGAGLAVCDG